MNISGIRLDETDGHKTLSAKCNDFELYYRFPNELNVQLSADPFVAACLIPAMNAGTDICIEGDVSVSAELLRNTERLQTIFSMWEGQLGHKLSRIEIQGNVKEPAVSSEKASEVMSFFSGGVDGTYTFLEHEDEIDYLLFVKGIDMQLTNDGLFSQALEKNRIYLEQRGKKLLPCETNVRFLGHENGLKWGVCFGGGLSSIAIAAGAGRCLLASGVTYAATSQEGSNYITDHLWSNSITDIVHDGAQTNRGDKIRRISQDAEALNILRVCWQDKSYNCGVCEKCLRTMTTMRLLDVSSPNFPRLSDKMVKESIATLRIYGVQNFSFVEENLALAQQVGDLAVIKALQKVRRNYLLRLHGRGLISAFR